MKNIYNYLRVIFILATITLSLASCSSEDFTAPNEAGIPMAANYEDAVKIDVDQETNTVTFSFTNTEVIPFWTIHTSKVTYSSKRSFTQTLPKAGDYLVEVKIFNVNGQSDGVISRTITINKSLINGFPGFVYNSQFNIWKRATISTPTFWYAPGWSQIADPVYTFQEPTYSISLPKATTDQWQSQMIIATDFGSSAALQYDFSVILTSTKKHPGVTVKLVDSSDDNVYYFAARVELDANQPKCFYNDRGPLKGLDVSKLKLVLDFGGNADETDITIENIVFKNHADDDGTVVPEVQDPEPNWVGVNSPDNLWNGSTSETTFFYAPGWAQLPDPTFTVNGTEYSLSYPTATAAQWQNQVTFTTANLSTTASENYDFKVTLTATKDIKAVTAKLAQNDDDNVFLFLSNQDLAAGESISLKAINKPGVDISRAKLVLDFGGNPDNTDVVIKDIILQKHKD